MSTILQLSKTAFACLSVFPVQQLTRFEISNTIKVRELIHNCSCKNSFHFSCLLNKASLEISKDKSKPESSGKPEKKKKEKLTYITLVESDNNVTVTTLEDATKLALRRDLKLIKIKEYETKSERPTYQLMTTSQYLAEEKKNKSKFDKKNSFIKGTKLVSISSKINNHDINAKVKNMIKWLDKRYEVRIVISNDNGEAESVYSNIAEAVKENGKVVQKRMKGADLKFQIVPLKKEAAETDSSSTNSTKESSVE